MYSRSNRRTGRANVKSGCRTCKIRKVKCDEDRPACRRCISTGRVCDGYGILGSSVGGRGYLYGHRQHCLTGSRDTSRAIPRPPASVSVLASSGTSEKGYFDWFRSRTVTKLPGSFVSSFWTTLLLQASVAEPAVLHAILALSSVHRSGTIHAADGGQSQTEESRNERERFTLQHYVKAIGHLQPHFSAVKDKASCRVALITCVVFVCLDFLRGHFQTAQVHLENGLKILGEMHMLLSDGDGNDDWVLHLKPCRESTDDWIVEAFSRLHLQVALFKHASYQHPCLLALQDQTGLEKTPALLVFRSVNEAWRQMGRLLNKLFYLTHQCRLKPRAPACEPIQNQKPRTLLEHQQQIQTSLTQWLTTYAAFENAVPPGHQRSADEEKCYQLLYVYHTMATIMAATCLRPPNDELIFDSHTDDFVLLIKQSARLWTLSSTGSLVQAQSPTGQFMDMASSVVDMGWIPPLYYAAVKCRVHRVRLQAIRLLESTSHREGIWDARTAACVARKIVEIEERDFYEDVDAADDDFPLASFPRPRDLSLPTLPDSYRIRGVEVVLEGGPMDKISLFYRQKRDGGDCGVFLSEYSVRLQRWGDRGCG